ncbi:DUF6234 family protein [Streptomyces sp. NBC_01102]|uniref:DUF6234 family protein n=1 Tax=Streptomyces sp. NBC_01102 TaxID=2903749 RepID=UPI00386AFE63|nr:DUF6234 family protein [Streptomyces sp. NBC_01102]
MFLLAGDLVLGIALTAVECGALAAFWYAESFRTWAAREGRVPGSTKRVLLVLTAAPVVLASVGYLAFRTGLRVTCATQALLAAPLVVLLVLGLGAEGGRLVTGRWGRRRGPTDTSGGDQRRCRRGPGP